MKSLKSAYARIRVQQREIRELQNALAGIPMEHDEHIRHLKAVIGSRDAELELARSNVQGLQRRIQQAQDTIESIGISGASKIRSLEDSVAALKKMREEADDRATRNWFVGFGWAAVPAGIIALLDYLPALLKAI